MPKSIRTPIVRVLAEPEIRTECRRLVAEANERKAVRASRTFRLELAVTLVVLAAIAFASGYALGTYDGTKYAVAAYEGRR